LEEQFGNNLFLKDAPSLGNNTKNMFNNSINLSKIYENNDFQSSPNINNGLRDQTKPNNNFMYNSDNTRIFGGLNNNLYNSDGTLNYEHQNNLQLLNSDSSENTKNTKQEINKENRRSNNEESLKKYKGSDGDDFDWFF